MNSHKWLFMAAALIIIGIVVCGASFAAMGFDFGRLSFEEAETNTYEIGERFDRIAIRGDTDDVTLLPSEDGSCRVICRETERQRHKAAVENGTLTVETIDTRRWYDHIGILSCSPEVTVYLPEHTYESLSVDMSTGDIDLSELTVVELSLSVSTGDIRAENIACSGSINLHVSTGKASLQNVTCKNLSSDGSTGRVTLKNVAASGSFMITRSTGDIRFESCDAASITVRTTTGDITGSLLSEKIFVADTSTGMVDIPQTTTGGRCELSASTGDIQIEIRPESGG